MTTAGHVGIGTVTPAEKLDVAGSVRANGTVLTSDRRWKKDIETLTGALNTVQRLRGVRYRWRQDEFPDKNFPKGEQLGLIAQEVEEVVPEVVHTDDDGYKSLEYAKLVPVLLEAVKEQQAQLDTQQNLIANLIQQQQAQQAQLEALRAELSSR